MSTGSTNSQIKEHMKVVCSLGMHVGTVDHLEGDKIKLTKDASSDQKHHYIPASLVTRVDQQVHLSKPCDEVKATWESE